MITNNKPVTTLLVDLDGGLRRWPEVTNLIEDRHGLPHGAIERVAFASVQLQPVIRGIIRDSDWRVMIAKELHQQYPQNAVRLWSEPVGELDLRPQVHSRSFMSCH